MHNKAKIISLISIVILAFSMFIVGVWAVTNTNFSITGSIIYKVPAPSEDDLSGIFIFTFDDSTKTASVAAANTDIAGDIKIPAEVERTSQTTASSVSAQANQDNVYTVTSIADAIVGVGGTFEFGEGSFANCTKITSITIPDTIVKIGAFAFYKCTGLTSLELPDKLKTISDSAFDNSGLINLSIPASVESIGSSILGCCNQLTAITVSPQNTTYEDGGGNAIIEKSTKSLIQGCKNTEIPNCAEIIGIYSFEGFSELKTLDIPDNITSIEYKAFYYCGLESVEIGCSATSIEGGSFVGCKYLTKITVSQDNPVYEDRSSNAIIEISTDTLVQGCNATIIPDSVSSIGSRAFYECAELYNILIPSSVQSIGNSAFYQCDLLSIDIPDSVSSIDNYAFALCKRLKTATLSSNLNSLSEAVFNASGLTNIRIPQSVTTINTCAFLSCNNLSYVIIPNTTTTIGGGAFVGCKTLSDVYFGGLENDWNEVEILTDNYFENDIGLTSDQLNFATTADDATFDFDYNSTDNTATVKARSTSISGMIELPKHVVKDGVLFEIIGVSASGFSSCASIENVTIPHEVSISNDKVFYNCDLLKTVTIPEGIETIGSNAFYSCAVLANAPIPSTVTSIGANAFAYCSSITTIDISEKITSIGSNVFNGCGNLTSITVADENTVYEDMDCNAIIEKSSKTLLRGCWSTTIPSGVLKIGAYAFNNITHLFNMAIPEGIESIGANAFYGSKITSVTIADSVTSIGGSAFYNCTNLSTVTLPSEITIINPATFYGCSSLKNVTIPSKVTIIQYSAFSDCSSLKNITIPSKVTTIGNSAFSNCGLTSLTIPASVTSLSNAFINCSYLRTISVEEGNTVYDSRDNCNAIIKTSTNTLLQGSTLTTIPSTVTGIGPNAFYGNINLTNIAIPSSVTNINDSAFKQCSNLMTIIFPNSVSRVWYNAFDECSRLSDVYFAGVESSWSSVTIDTGNTYLTNAEIHYAVSASEVSSTYAFTSYNAKTVKIQAASTSISGAIELPKHLIEGGTVYEIIGIATAGFSGCSQLTSVVVPFGYTSLGDSAFFNCTKLTSITLPDTITDIGSRAFYNVNRNASTGMSTIKIPTNVTYIGDEAFAYTRITRVTIPANVTHIGSGLFKGCTSLSTISVDSNNKIYDCRNSCNAIIETATNTLIAGCRYTKIPSDVEIIGNQAFAGSTGLSSIIIPNSVTTISDKAFMTCTSLADVYYIGSSSDWDLITIGTDNTYVTSANIHFVVDANTTEIFDFDYNASNKSASVALSYDDGRSYFQIPEFVYYNNVIYTVTAISDYGFANTESLSTVVMPNSILSIGSYAFSDCVDLSDITFSENLVSIGDYAFKNCNSASIMGLPISLKTIGKFAFEGVGEVGSESDGLIYISDLTGSVVNFVLIGVADKEITSCIVSADCVIIAPGAFDGCGNLREIIVDSLVYRSTNSNGEEINAIIEIATNTLIRGAVVDRFATVSEEVTTIGAFSFSGCETLTEITITNSVTSIEDFAFAGCNNLQVVYFAGSYEEWDALMSNLGEGNEVLMNVEVVCI